MAAYSAAVTFRQTLQQLLDSDFVPLDFPKPQIQSLHKNVCYLQSSLEQIAFVPKKWRGKMRELETNIRDAIYLGQDKVEYLIKGSSPERYEEIPFKKIEDAIAATAEDAKQMVEDIKEDPQAQYLFSENSQPTKFNHSGRESIVAVGQQEDFIQIKEWLELDDRKLLLVLITGLPGIGKTTLARSIYDDQKLKNQFNMRAWVTVSQEYNYQEIFANLLNTLESKNYQAGHYATQGDEQRLRNCLHQELFNQKFLIVIDDVWDIHIWNRMKLALRDNENGSRIIFTTRDPAVADRINYYGLIHNIRPLSLNNSWELLCRNVFGDDDCPPELREIGLRIAKKCEGLPLSITVIGGLLSQQREEITHWKRIEEDADDAGDSSYQEIISLSYNYLPAKLKACFLYMGAFPADSEIRVSKLIKLWVAEGFLSMSRRPQVWEDVAQDFLKELANRNLILVRKVSSNCGIKACGMHNSLREVAQKESRKEFFFYSMNKYGKMQGKDLHLQMQRRVSFHRNILTCLEDVYNSTRSIRHARSLLYVGPHHHHPLPFCLTFDLLRVLDAFTVYFIEFPDEFLKLIHLTYLSLTYNHDIPPQISKLQQLQVFMVRRQPKIIFVGVSFVPDEIWEMPNLRHLWFTETDFPLPPRATENRVLLLNLQTLANVNAAFFTDEVLDNMPNLKKLSMWIEGPEEIMFDLRKLSKLEFFKFVVLNPIPGEGVGVEPERLFPKTVKRLHLSGCGFPWHYLKFIADELKDLQVLKLRELAFHGEEWSQDYKFGKLKFLLIEYLNFKTWESSSTNFPSLQRLILRHCYDLEEIPSDIGFIGMLEVIELVDCSPDAVASAECIREEQDHYDKQDLRVNMFSSWE